MKKTLKITIFLISQIVLFSVFGKANPALALCQPLCNPVPSVQICLPVLCNDCPWCLAPVTGEGIYNPVINPSVGTGVGAVILAKLIAEFMSVAFILAGVALLGMILFSAFEWMTAGGDENKLKSAQKRLTNALIGFIILVSARAILGFIAGPLGVPWLETLKIVWPTP